MATWSNEASRQYYREYYLANKQRKLAGNRKRKAARTPEQVAEDKVTAAAYAREYAHRPDGRAKLQATGRAWDAAHRSERAAATKRQRDEHPDRVAAAKAVRRARELGASGSYSAQDVRDCLAQQGGRCFYCLASLLAGYHVDHMMPLSRGGSNNADNIVCACASCNLRKHAKTAEEFILSNL